MGDRIDIPEARGYLSEFREGLQSLFNQTKSDHEQDALKVYPHECGVGPAPCSLLHAPQKRR